MEGAKVTGERFKTAGKRKGCPEGQPFQYNQDGLSTCLPFRHPALQVQQVCLP